ncbi:MAG TPA: class I SAM-dependent methyltransferase [Pyrinomonadaceae bacterium]|nr:class I SAM-dependent methyltransferase [Pyrinomonadaceae bacterium]
MNSDKDIAAAERARIQAEYVRRDKDGDRDLYAAWQPTPLFMQAGRKRIASRLLHGAGFFPFDSGQCLEIGFGSMGWLADLISWGVPETDLHGIELSSERVSRARQVLPQADLRVGDAGSLPWETGFFRLVIASTVFTSILNDTVRRMVAREILRVLAPGGALLWYDFAVNNPNNAQVRGIGRKELRELFPDLRGEIRSATLAPPLARFVAPRSWAIASALEAIPLLRTHLLAVMVKSV